MFLLINWFRLNWWAFQQFDRHDGYSDHPTAATSLNKRTIYLTLRNKFTQAIVLYFSSLISLSANQSYFLLYYLIRFYSAVEI